MTNFFLFTNSADEFGGASGIEISTLVKKLRVNPDHTCDVLKSYLFTTDEKHDEMIFGDVQSSANFTK